mgnify:FL=1
MKLTRKTKYLVSLIGLFALLFCVQPVLAIESIPEFETEITVNKDGSFLVEELITYDFSNNQRHGIFRHIPLAHPQPASKWYRERVIDIEIEHVTRNGAAEPYELSEGNGYLEIKIGDANSTISGQHDYRIAYRVQGGLSYYTDIEPELYWDVTGTEWPVVLSRVEVTLLDPHELFTTGRACYQGAEESNRSCESMTATTSQVVFTASNVLSGQGLTIAQRISGSKVSTQILERTSPLFTWVPGIGAGLLVLVGLLYRIKTRHKPDVPIVSQYEPYPGVLPMFTGVLLDGRLDPRDITAGLLYLAEQGFIKIRKTEHKVLFVFEIDDYELTLLRDISEVPSHFHEEILSLLFASFDTGTTMKLSELKKDMSKQRANAKRLSRLRSAVADDVIERGFYEHVVKAKYIVSAFLLAFGLFFVGGMTLDFLAISVNGTYIWLAVSAVILLAVGVAVVYRRRTYLGYEALNHLKGFKDFLSVTGEERFKFHNAPSKNPEQFLEYLPYAVALGVEKEWADVFKDVTIPTPGWYEGGSVDSFNAAALATDLGSFSTAFASSSGSSGSSGGGSVGGGSGGGGGGSW